jgi:hypothetical protein
LIGKTGQSNVSLSCETCEWITSRSAQDPASSFLRKLLARQLTTRITPKLRFSYDASLVQGEKITRALMADRKARPRQEEEDFGP